MGILWGNEPYLSRPKLRRATGSTDVIAFGRPVITNPDLVARFQHGLPLAEAGRNACYGGGAAGYTDWPTAATA